MVPSMPRLFAGSNAAGRALKGSVYTSTVLECSISMGAGRLADDFRTRSYAHIQQGHARTDVAQAVGHVRCIRNRVVRQEVQRVLVQEPRHRAHLQPRLLPHRLRPERQQAPPEPGMRRHAMCHKRQDHSASSCQHAHRSHTASGGTASGRRLDLLHAKTCGIMHSARALVATQICQAEGSSKEQDLMPSDQWTAHMQLSCQAG